MPVLDSSDFSADTGWTLGSTTTETFNQSIGGRTAVVITAGGTDANSGIFRTTPIAGAAGHVIYVDLWMPDTITANGFGWGISDSGSLSLNQGILIYSADGTWYFRQDGNNTTNAPDPITQDSWVNLRWKFLTDANAGKVAFAYHIDDGTAQDQIDEGDWTTLFTSAIASSFDATASDIYMKLGLYEQATNYSRFNYTDDGVIESGGGGSIHSQGLLQGSEQGIIQGIR